MIIMITIITLLLYFKDLPILIASMSVLNKINLCSRNIIKYAFKMKKKQIKQTEIAKNLRLDDLGNRYTLEFIVMYLVIASCAIIWFYFNK